MAMALVLSLPLLFPINYAQAIVIPLRHCSLEEQRSEATALVGAGFIEACKDDIRSNLASGKVAVAGQGFHFLNLGSLVVAGEEGGSPQRRQ